MSLLTKALIGVVMVVVIALVARTRNYYVAGLVPLFPTFALVAHYIVGTERSESEPGRRPCSGCGASSPTARIWARFTSLPVR
jgi:uncharacterized membrane protein (GlpM family)